MDVRALALNAQEVVNHASEALAVILVGSYKDLQLPTALDRIVADSYKQGDLSAQQKMLYVHRPEGFKAKRLFIALADNGSPKTIKKCVAGVLAQLRSSSVKNLTICLMGQDWTESLTSQVVCTIYDCCYLYRHTKPSAPSIAPLEKINLATPVSAKELTTFKRTIEQATGIAKGVELAKECGNRPGNVATPTFLAQQAKALAKDHGFKVEVLDRKAVEKLGMGAFLAVSQGSEEPLQFIVLKYEGAAKTQAPVALVGKGITFDTGGISIKPAAEMDEMKFDMCGAASVLGVFKALGEIKPKVNVVGVIPTCDNMPSGRAVKPGDVVTSMSGKTIEILNTDAEGRLILCDALTYVQRFKPQTIIDIATLTGACVIALGHQHSGLFTNDDVLAQDLIAAGQSTQDTVWRMPMDDDYSEGLKSNFADLANVGPRAGGAITAAVFLKQFTEGYRWAHLDIAGTAWKSGGNKGATGRPVCLLTQFLLQQAKP